MKDLRAYLESDLQTPRLDKIHKHLWLAGLPRAARPLHRQKLLNRTIIVTENPDEHLVWHESRVFVKPLPEYLLSYTFWMQQLEAEFQDESLRKAAYGLLLSYSWIVCYKHDLIIAQSAGLLPMSITWENWVIFIANFLNHIDQGSLSNVAIRYRYGELRLSRLNRIYRFCPSVFSATTLIKGFASEPTWYKDFFVRNFSWIFALFACVTVILSAMQVGLGTEQLQRSQRFQQASAGFAIAGLVIVTVSTGLVFSVWGFLFFFHLIWAMQNRGNTITKQRTAQAPTV